MMWEFSESGKVVGNSSSSKSGKVVGNSSSSCCSCSIGLWGAMMWELVKAGK